MREKPTWIWLFVELVLENDWYTLAPEALPLLVLLADAHLAAAPSPVQDTGNNASQQEHGDNYYQRKYKGDKVAVVGRLLGRGVADVRRMDSGGAAEANAQRGLRDLHDWEVWAHYVVDAIG